MTRPDPDALRYIKRRFRSKREQYQAYIVALARSGFANEPAAIVGVDRITPYYWRRTVPGFAQACTDAVLIARARGRQRSAIWAGPTINDRRIVHQLDLLDREIERDRDRFRHRGERDFSTEIATPNG